MTSYMPAQPVLRSRCSAGPIAGAGAQCCGCGCCLHHHQQPGGRSCPLSLLVLRQLQQQARAGYASSHFSVQSAPDQQPKHILPKPVQQRDWQQNLFSQHSSSSF